MHTFHTDAKVFTDMPKCCKVITLHIWSTLAPISGSITWGGQPGHARSSVLLIPSSNISCTSQTLLYAADSCCHTHASFENESLLVCHLLLTEIGRRTVVCARMNPWISCTEQHAVVQRSHKAACLWNVRIVVGSDNCWMVKEWWTLRNTYPDNTCCTLIYQTTHIIPT